MQPTQKTPGTVMMHIALPLPGEICTQYIRCGKAGCRCGRGYLHGPYHYRVWREGDKVRKVYVRRADVAAVQARCDLYKDIQTRLRQMRLERQELTKRIAGQCRTTKRLLRPLQHAGRLRHSLRALPIF